MKKTLTLFALLLSLSSIFAQAPANDDCSGLVDLGIAPICPILDTFTNVNATQSVVFSTGSDNIPSCFTGGTVDRDVWFSFTVPPSGDIIDFTVTVTGIDGPNGNILQPQVAVYRGDCELDGLQELNCATSAPGETEVSIDLQGLTPGLPYFLRISDWSASASPNWGDFVLCIKEFVPVYNMGDGDFSSSCEGTLFDSGGPADDYENGENSTFTVCPQDFTQCILLNLETVSLEDGFDFLHVYIGEDTNGPEVANLTGFYSGVPLQVYGQCVTFEFTSDFSSADTGFEITWTCSPDTCTIPPPSTCDNPTVIGSLPYTANDLTTCFATNAVDSSPCNDNSWMQGEDVIFTYTSPGDECISISLTGTATSTGVGIFDGCPETANDCIATAGGGFGQFDPSISAAFLQNPGTYYIVVDNPVNCTAFNIEVNTTTCPIVLPSAADCENALSLNGCGDLPAIVSVAPGEGDPGVIQDGVNLGCWGAFFPLNFTWFFFQAQEDGNFGFTMQADNPDEASDIDFQVWGPITNVADLCSFSAQNEPIRSSYAGGEDPTGLADIHPVLGTPVNDDCEDAGGDDFVSTIPVLTGEFYVVLINDWGGQITSGAVAIDFGNTTQGVLNTLGADFMVTQDTAVCPGESAQLLASGGEVYQWFPTTGLSCQYCPDPVATVSQTTNYQVAINSVCNSDTLDVEVGFLEVDAGPDLTVCLNEDIQIVAGASFANVGYAWTGQTGFLSCTDCPNPIVTATQAGTFNFIVTVTGPTCAFSDMMTLTVLPATAPSFQISDDQNICFGETVNLGGNASPGVTYAWSSNPAGFNSSQPNPSVTPNLTTTYYLQATNALCPIASMDSVTVIVSALPIVDVGNDTTICQGQSLALGNTTPEAGVTYQWMPSQGLDNANLANPVATPTQSTVYTLSADRFGCVKTETVNISVIPIDINISNPDTIPICKGVSVPLIATAIPAGTTISWLPNNGSLSSNTGTNVIATPETATAYIASVTTAGCVRFDTIYIGVDSLPWNTEIMPEDTIICLGQQVLLTSPLYEPGDFSQIEFQWTGQGQLTPDSFYNMVAQPLETTTYYRTATNGFCARVDSSVVTVIDVSSLQVMPTEPVICVGDTVHLSVTSNVPMEYTWSPSDGLSCTDCPDPVASPSQSTPYTVKGSFEGCSITATVNVTVASIPGFSPLQGVICPGAVVGLNPSGDASLSYNWSSPDDPTFNSTDANPVVTLNQTTDYSVTVSNGVCPPQTFTFTAFVSNNPSLTVSSDTILCGVNSIQLFADSGEPGGNYLWSTGQAEANPVVSLALGLNNFSVVYTNACGDTLSGDVLVELTPGIDVEINPLDTNTFYQGTVLNLSTTTSTPPVSYQWSNGGVSDTTNFLLLNLPSEAIWVTVTDDLGCTDTDSLNFNVLESLFDIPNAFSPNGDSKNDRFKVVILGENIEVLSMNIWNRWGQQVYEEKNGNEGWDGEQNGDPAASDVYVFKIQIRQADGSTVTRSGDLTLLR